MMREIETEKKAMQDALKQRLAQADALKAEHQQLQDGLKQCCTVYVSSSAELCVCGCVILLPAYHFLYSTSFAKTVNGHCLAALLTHQWLFSLTDCTYSVAGTHSVAVVRRRALQI